MDQKREPDFNSNRSTPSQFRSKLGTYLTGVFIGFLILGGIYYQKHLATKRLDAQRAQEASLNSSDTNSDMKSEQP
ncbi:MAG: hypothetical protein P1U42_03300 [Phycisphaerales bacterium]|nr:hypothetical protein [Phycisphaerales bacterium]